MHFTLRERQNSLNKGKIKARMPDTTTKKIITKRGLVFYYNRCINK